MAKKLSVEEEFKDAVKKKYEKENALAEQEALKDAEASAEQQMPSVLYFPVITDKVHYVVKMRYNLAIDAGILSKAKFKSMVEGITILEQRVIAFAFPKDQESLKFYYEKGDKK
jgi:hypothetical protein